MRLIFLLLFLLLTSCDDNSSNLALGTLERDRIAHTATVNEVIVELPVKQGTVVSKGTLLVKLDDTFQKAQVSRAEAMVAQAEANLDKLRSGARIEEVAAATAKVEGAEASLKESESNYNRLKNLIKKNLVSKAIFDSSVAKRDNAKANLKNAHEELLKLTNGTRVEDLNFGEAQLKSANASLLSEQKKLADLSIISTRDGILDNLPWNLGERVTTGSPLAIILAGKAPYARVYIPEPYRVKLSVGDALAVRVDGIEKPITGQLRWISSEPAFTPYYALNQKERSRLMYLAEIQLPDSQSHLPNGVPAQVELP